MSTAPDVDKAPCWSVDGEDFCYHALDYLLDCNEHLASGAVVWQAEAVPVTPRELCSADDVIELMSDRAGDIAGEYADGYPSVGPAAIAELNKLLGAWIGKHCSPDFYRVKNRRPYTLTDDDVPPSDDEGAV